MRVWITGANGFLGRHMVKALAEGSMDVVELTRQNVDLSQSTALPMLDKLREKHGLPDAVLHLASRQPGPFSLGEFVAANVSTTANIIDWIHKNKVGTFLYTSTISVYEKPNALPVSEKASTRGSTAYTITKLAAEDLIRIMKPAASNIILRLPSLYGVGQRDSFIDGLARLAKEGQPLELFHRGKRIRDSLHVSDVTKAIVSCLHLAAAHPFSIYNLGCGQAVTVEDYAKKIVRHLKSNSPILPVDKIAAQDFDIYLDISLARRELGFSPKRVDESIEHYAQELQN